MVSVDDAVIHQISVPGPHQLQSLKEFFIRPEVENFVGSGVSASDGDLWLVDVILEDVDHNLD